MEGHRHFTQYVQPMDRKGFLIQDFKHLLNVIKQLGPLKHSTEMSQITWIYSSHFSLSMWIRAELYSLATILFSNASEMILMAVTIYRDWTERRDAFCMDSVDARQNQQRLDKGWSFVIAMFSYSMRPQHPKNPSWELITMGSLCGVIVPPCRLNTITWIRAEWLNNQQQRKLKMPE